MNTSTVNSDGTGGTSIGYIDLANPGLVNTGISCVSITGDVAIFAGDFKLSSAPRGYRPGSLASGGRKLETIAAMNMTSRQQWMAALSPAVVVNNFGMNDRTTRSAAQFQADLEAVTAANAAGAPNAVQVIVTPNESDDFSATNLDDYVAVRRSVARSRGAIYHDERSVLGSYANATAAGLMNDTIHPSLAGNRRRSRGLAVALGVPPGLADPGKTAYAGGGGATPTYYGTLTRKRGSLAASTPLVVHRIGLTNGSPTAILDFVVRTQRGGTGAGVERRFSVTLNNSTTVNAVTTASGVTTAVLHQVNAGDGFTLDVTPSVAVVSGKAEVTLTPNAYAGLYDIEGSYTFTNLANAGQSVYEN